MGSVAESVSQITYGLTKLNNKTAIGGGQARLGAVGFTGGLEKSRRAHDNIWDVPPSPGDSGYVAPATPNVTPVTPMPIPGQDDLANISARRRSIEQQLARRGRLSTVLSNPQNEPLGG
jgi:hypothetical protein